MKIHEKFWKGYFIGLVISCFLILLFSLLFGGCSTARLSGDDTGLVSAGARAAGRLEGTVKELDRTVENSRERIGIVVRASERLESGVDRLEYLFGEYEQEVGRLLDEIDRIRGEAEGEGTDNPGGNSPAGHVRSGADRAYPP